MGYIGQRHGMLMKLQLISRQGQSVWPHLKLFLIIFLCVGFLLAGAITFFYQIQIQNYVERLKKHELLAVDIEGRIVDNIFENVTADLVYLSQEEALQAYLKNGQEQYLDVMAKEYLAMSLAKKQYDQIRFLNDNGMELVRVDYHRGKPSIVPKNKLQNKAKRYYFNDTLSLNRNQIFVSPFDLNVEQGRLETPLKPMIRFGIVVFDNEGNKRGVVLINYLGEKLLNLLVQTGEAMYGQPLLVNRDGYWLLGLRPEDAWGFMLTNRKDRTIFKQFPVSAPPIMKQTAGQFMNKEGIFSFATIYPLKHNQKSSTGSAGAFACSQGNLTARQYHWRLVSYISSEEVEDYSLELMFNLALLGATLFLLTAVASWIISAFIIRNRLHRDQLFNMANFDNLTGLPNRNLYFDRLGQTYEYCKRHARIFAILYIDLDDFKKVNDTLGHKAGDIVLTETSRRMLNLVRKSDTVGRMGGDEFMMILSDLAQPGDAEVVAKKILSALSEPVGIGEKQARVGACIGLAIYPNDSDDIDKLIKLADEAMYACKAAGKNLYITASSIKNND